MFNRREAGGRGGLGLAIAQAFLEAHGERIRVEDAGRPARASGRLVRHRPGGQLRFHPPAGDGRR